MNIFFDLGNTLILPFRQYNEVLFRNFSSVCEIDENILEKILIKRYDLLHNNKLCSKYKQILEYKLFQKIIEDNNLNYTIIKAVFSKTRKEYMNVKNWICHGYIYSTLSYLQNKGYRMGIISNWDDTFDDFIDYFNLGKYFITIVVSYKLGIEKPNIGIFEYAFINHFKDESCNFLPNIIKNNTYYVGDDFTNDIKPSLKIGISPIHLVGDNANYFFEYSRVTNIKRIDELKNMF